MLCALALALAGCSVEPGELPGPERALALPDAPAPTPGFGLIVGEGVTPDEPCPQRINPDNGCIYLGALVDLSGPLKALGEAALAGAEAFWRHVNDEGGVVHRPDDGIEAAFSVDVGTYTRDTRSDPQVHLDQYRDIESSVLALAVSFGTPTTDEALAEYGRDHMVAAPIGWWSGWAFEPLVAESGANYCLQALNGMDFAYHRLGGGTPIDHVVVVHHDNLYGSDVVNAVDSWTERARGERVRVPFDPLIHAVPVRPGADDLDEAVDRVVAVSPEVVVVATGPDQLATLATRTAQRGWDGLLIGMSPTFVPSLLDDPEVAEVLSSQYLRVTGFAPLAHDSTAYRHMRRELGLAGDDGGAQALPANDFWIAGWVSQYPLLKALEEAVTSGDLTRPGVAAAIEAVTVKYDGALDWTNYHGDPNALANRKTSVFQPEQGASLGQRVVADSYTGDTAQAAYFARPCTET